MKYIGIIAATASMLLLTACTGTGNTAETLPLTNEERPVYDEPDTSSETEETTDTPETLPLTDEEKPINIETPDTPETLPLTDEERPVNIETPDLSETAETTSES